MIFAKNPNLLQLLGKAIINGYCLIIFLVLFLKMSLIVSSNYPEKYGSYRLAFFHISGEKIAESVPPPPVSEEISNKQQLITMKNRIVFSLKLFS